MNAGEDFWITATFVKPAEVYQVILKRRPDVAKYNRRVNTHIKVQYQDPDTKKWVYYENGALLPTNETIDTPAD